MWKFYLVIDWISEGRRERNKMVFLLDFKWVLISDSVDSCCKIIFEVNGIVVDLKMKFIKEEFFVEIVVRGR